MRWLAPLGYAPCPPALERALERSLGAERWPEELAGWRMLRFAIDRAPALPPGPDCSVLKAVPGPDALVHLRRTGPGGDRPSRMRDVPGGAGRAPSPHSGQEHRAHVRHAYERALAGLGVPTPGDWLEEFRRLFAGGRAPGGTVLLFPGAGHPLKQWPLVQFFQLAKALEERALEPVFVLGPAELERGIIPEGHAWTAPQSLEELERLLLQALAVVGGDTGPMHLAGMLGVPGVSLFGPTSFSQWGPVGMREASLGLHCSPCTATCADLRCDKPRCLEGITPERALEELGKAVASTQNRLSRPWFP